MAKYVIDDTTLTGIADAIRGKTSGTEPIAVLDMARQIEDIKIGGGDTPADGEEWIGDGNTHIWISLPEGRTSPMLGVCPYGTVTVDWGDGTTPDVLTGTSTSTVKYTPNHNYAAAGDYVITLTVDGVIAIAGDSSDSGSYLLRNSTSAGDGRNFSYRNAVKRVEFGNGVTSIGSYAFSYCHSLASVKIPASVTSIYSYAFASCFSLASINIPGRVTNIGDNAFQYCYSLASVNISDGVKKIGNHAFYQCYSLASINIPDSVTSIGDRAFYYCDSLGSITIPDSVTSIGTSAFNGCVSLESITIPDSVTSIGGMAFYSCYSLASINIPDGVTSIGSSVFYYCYSLANIKIPNSVTSIGSSAFYYCRSLGKIRFEGTTPPTVSDSYAFNNNVPTDCIISVPIGSLNAYKTAANYPDPSTYTYIEE